MRPALAVALCILAAAGCRDAPRYDVVLLGGQVVDGTGGPAFAGDVAILGERIALVAPAGTLDTVPARERLRLRGHVVAPGFIDILSQSRHTSRGNGRMVSKVTQGVTTEILGEGVTPAPANEKTGFPVPPAYHGARGFAAWLADMETRGVSVNLASFVGASTVRRYAMAGRAGPPSPAELDTMRAVVRRAMEDGALGLGTALVYAPGSYATTDELIELARAVAPYGGVYATHLRSEGDGLLEAVDEALAIGLQGGVPVEIHHLKAAGQRNWAKLPQVIARIDSARAAGQDVEANMYPYTAGRTRLSACLPQSASADGKLLERLADSAARARIRAEMLEGTVENLCRLATPEEVVVSGFRLAEHRQFEGARLAEAAGRLGVGWADLVMDWILREPEGIRATLFLGSEESLALLMRQPWVKVGTDGAAIDPVGATIAVHPRAYGTYPRVLGRFVRERQVLPLEEAVRKMTSAVAERLSLRDRGVVRAGMYADLVVFDPATVIDRATYAEPHRISEGVRHVFVNGVAVVRDGVHTGEKPGRILRGRGAAGPVPAADGPPMLTLRYPMPGTVVPGDSVALWGSTGSGRATLTVNRRPVRVEPNGAFVDWVPLPREAAPMLGFTVTLEGRSASRRVPIVRGRVRDPAPAPREAVGWVRLRRLPSDTLDSASLVRPITARRAPGGSYALTLPVGARLPMDARAGGAVRVRVSDRLRAWVLAAEADTLARPRPDLPLGPIRVLERDDLVELSAPLPEPLPSTVRVDGRTLRMSVHGAHHASDVLERPAGARFLREGGRRQRADGSAEVELRFAAPPRGWRTRWADGRLVLEVRRPRAGRGLAGLVVALDAGHPTGGTTGPAGLREDSVTLAIARAAGRRLEALGARPVLVRTDERPLSPSARLVVAEAAGADLFVSIHMDAPAPDESPWAADGTKVFYSDRTSRTLAGALHDSVAAAAGQRRRGVAIHDLLLVLRSEWFPSVLVEGTCLVLPEREAWLRTPAGIEAFAEGIARGVAGWSAGEG